jgi:dihydrofolate reductase
MRNLILQMQTSIDGFVARTDGDLNWLVWNFSDNWTWDTGLQTEFNHIFTAIDGIVLSGDMGAGGYIDHWTGMANDHRNDPQFAFAQKIADVPKSIFSNTLKTPHRENTSIISGDLTEKINALKGQDGKGLITFGGASFAASLRRSGLVDELQLFVNPVVLGSGISIFQGIPNLKPELLGGKGYACGISVLKYRLS